MSECICYCVDKQVYQKVIDHFGETEQKDHTIKEFDELADEIRKEITLSQLQMPNLENIINQIKENIISEIGDCYNMLEQLKIMYNISDSEIMAEMKRKMDRTLARIEKETKDDGT